MTRDTPAVPRPATTLTSPALELERQCPANRGEIERWFRRRWLRAPAPFYMSYSTVKVGPGAAGHR